MHKLFLASAVLALVTLTASRTAVELQVPECSEPFQIDGRLEEKAYTGVRPLTSFVVAGEPARQAPRTAAWVFWNDQELVFAFDCEDATPIALEPSADERAVDGQDRVELFLWSGDPRDTYYCIEVAALGAVHDYGARFYRRFDSRWSVPGWKYAVSRTAKGYAVEAAISKNAMGKCGFRLRPRARFRAGLFRADFRTHEPNQEPTWITWVDARTPQPDFHVAGSFGSFKLVKSAPR